MNIIPDLVKYYPRFVVDPDDAFDRLWRELAWERRSDAPRREYFASDIGLPYAYGRERGRRIYEPRPWHPVMLETRRRLEAFTGAVFEVCFVNGYEGPRDWLGWHSDDSPEMDDTRPIVSVSLGAARELQFRRIPRRDLIGPVAPTESVLLEQGSACVMEAETQNICQHRVPKAGHACGPRVSLTYRGYVQPA